MRKRIKIALIALICLLLSACGITPAREEVFELVLENEETLRAAIEENPRAEFDGIDFSGHYEEQGYTKYLCGGVGFPDGLTYGFYYTEDDEAKPGMSWAALVGNYKMEEHGSGYIIYYYSDWENKSGQYGSWYTEKICDNFWYWSEEI